METDPNVKRSFEEVYPELQAIIARRRGAWVYVSVMEFADVAQILILRLWLKYPLYDPARGNGPPEKRLEKWANRLISNAIQNLCRDVGGRRLQKPCVGGGAANGKSCTYNLGADSCSYTPSRMQCAECPLYAKWEKERKAQHYVKAQVSLENHTQEVHSKPDDSIDVAAIKDWLHGAMLAELTRWEGRVYRLSIMQELPPARVVEILQKEVTKRKRPLAEQEGCTYGHILQYNRTFRGMMRQVLLREGHIGPEHMDPNRNRRRSQAAASRSPLSHAL